MKNVPPITSDRLPQKLKTIRIALKLSQSEILERIGFSDHLFRSNISQYERGLRVPALAVVLAYARLANLDVAALIDDDLDLPGVIPNALKSDSVPPERKRRS